MIDILVLVIIIVSGYFIYKKYIKGKYVSDGDNKPVINKIEDVNTNITSPQEDVKEHTVTLRKDKIKRYLKILPISFVLTSIVVLNLESSVKVNCYIETEKVYNYLTGNYEIKQVLPPIFKRERYRSYFGNEIEMSEFRGSYDECMNPNLEFEAYEADLGETFIISLVLNFILIYLLGVYSRNKIKIQLK